MGDDDRFIPPTADEIPGFADVLSEPFPAATAGMLHPGEPLPAAALDPETLLVEHDLYALDPGIDRALLEPRLRRLAAALTGVDALRQALVRDALIARLKLAKVARPGAIVDAALGRVEARAGKDDLQGRALVLADPEPWPDPVDGATLLEHLADTISTYVVLPQHAAVTIALWLLHAYFMDVLSITPILGITSPTKRCGKTLLLIVLGALVPRRLPTSSATAAVIFRAIEKYRPTLLIDEADTYLTPDAVELRGVINSGHTRGTAVVLRTVGDEHEPRLFSTWAAKAIALIGALPATIADRTIEIRMRRRAAGETVARLRQDRIDGDCADLRRQAARWAADHAEIIRTADPDVPDGLHDRAADCWRPLLAIADAAGGTWSERARQAAVSIAGGQDEGDVGVELLADIAAILDNIDDDLIGSSILLERLVNMEGRPWADYRNGKPMTARALAERLKRFSVLPTGKTRVGPDTLRGYRRAAFEDAFARYLPIKAEQRNKFNDDGQMFPFAKRNTEPECSALQSGTNSMNTDKCSAVPLQQGGSRAAKGSEDDDADYHA